MSIPPFSIFSALSEIVVTVVVLYTLLRCLRGGRFHWKLLGAVLIFEVCVNVVYMSIRAQQAEAEGSELAAGMRAFYAAHGILSLLMLVALITFYALAVVDEKTGRPNWFRRFPTVTWTFLFFWMTSVVSGEAIFVMRYLLPGSAPVST